MAGTVFGTVGTIAPTVAPKPAPPPGAPSMPSSGGIQYQGKWYTSAQWQQLVASGGGPASAGGGGAGTATATLDGKQILQNFLNQYGLTGINLNNAWSAYVSSGSNLDYWSNTWLTQQQAFQARFPAYQQLMKEGRGISVASYNNYITQMDTFAHQYGVPDGFFTPQVIGNMLLAGKDSTEVQSDLQDYAVALTHPAVQARLADAGLDPSHMTPGDLAAFFTDPKTAQPLLEQKFLQAQIGAASDINGVSVSSAEAAKLAGQDITAGQAQTGFGNVATSAPLLSGLPGSGQDNISTDTAADAILGGNAKAAALLKQRQDSRLAPFQGGGGFSASSGGFAGVGSAQSA